MLMSGSGDGSAGQRTVRTPKLSMFVLDFEVERCGGHRRGAVKAPKS